MMKSFRHIPTLLAGSIAITGGAIITPQTGTAIDPVGGEQIDTEASNSATLSDFNELSGLITQSDWAGIGGSTGNTIDGSDIDVRIDHSAGIAFPMKTNHLRFVHADHCNKCVKKLQSQHIH